MKKSNITLNWKAFGWGDKSQPHMWVTQIVEKSYPPFDRDSVAAYCHRAFSSDPESKYYNMSVQEIIDMWERMGAESQEYGHWIDEYATYDLLGYADKAAEHLKSSELDEVKQQMLIGYRAFVADVQAKYPDIEAVDSQKFLIYRLGDDLFTGGRFDALLYIPSKKKFIIIDWKANKEIQTEKMSRTDTFYGPMHMHYAHKGGRYSLQVLIYKRMLIEYLKASYPDTWQEYSVDSFFVNVYEGLEHDRPYKVFVPTFEYDPELLDEQCRYIINKHWNE